METSLVASPHNIRYTKCVSYLCICIILPQGPHTGCHGNSDDQKPAASSRHLQKTLIRCLLKEMRIENSRSFSPKFSVSSVSPNRVLRKEIVSVKFSKTKQNNKKNLCRAGGAVEQKKGIYDAGDLPSQRLLKLQYEHAS